MKGRNLQREFYYLLTISSVVLSLIEGKGPSSNRAGGIKTGSKGIGTFSGASSYGRATLYRPGTMQARPSSNGFKSNVLSFAAGAAGGIAAYSLMKSMASTYRTRPDGFYGPGYGVGDTCVNEENMNGTVFNEFRCPLYGFPLEAKSCCGEYGKQFCCIPESNSGVFGTATHIGWVVLAVVILLITSVLCFCRYRQNHKDVVMIPTDVPTNQDFEAHSLYHSSSYNGDSHVVPSPGKSGNSNTPLRPAP